MYPPLEEVITDAGIHEVETYVSRRQNRVVKLIATRPIMDLCLEAARRPGSKVANQCWEHYVLDTEGVLTAAQEAE